MKNTSLNGLKTATKASGLSSNKRRRFRDPRLRWMDEVLRSLEKPAPESWIPASYRYVYRQNKKAHRPVH